MCTAHPLDEMLDVETLDEAAMRDAAGWAHARGEAWHFHVLAPDCAFNPNRGLYTFLLELTDQDRRICTVFDGRPVAVNKELLALLHGEDALSNKADAGGELTEADRRLLDAIAAASTAGKGWHHHMMFPACALNGAKGSWRLFVEIDGESPMSLDYPVQPALLLNRIERLYFGIG